MEHPAHPSTYESTDSMMRMSHLAELWQKALLLKDIPLAYQEYPGYCSLAALTPVVKTQNYTHLSGYDHKRFYEQN